MRWFRKRDSDPILEEDYDDDEHKTGSFYPDALYGEVLLDEPPFPPANGAGQLPSADPLRPVQFSAPRVETLCISDKERDLYLAALSSLEQPAPPLVLYTDKPPALPTLPESSSPFSVPHIPYPASPATISIINPRTYPKAPSTKHAILTLVDDAGLRFTGFTPDAIVDADSSVRAAWKFGVSARSTDPAKLKALREPIVYRVELKGKAWNRKGSQELESIRLLLAIFTALGKHGFQVRGSIASMGKNDTLNLLFRAAPADERPPAPLFFALTLPLPDRIALVSAPDAASDSLIDAVRGSIFEVASEIKMEGWVHPGVYRFWIAGMRSFVGGMKNTAVEKLLPPLMVNVMDSLAALHFEWLTSIQLEPVGPGRDILIFSSTAKSGLGVKDAFVSEDITIAERKRTKEDKERKEKTEKATKEKRPPSPVLSYMAESPFNAFFPPDQNPYNPANKVKFADKRDPLPQAALPPMAAPPQVKLQPPTPTRAVPAAPQAQCKPTPAPAPAPAFGPPRRGTSLEENPVARPPRHPGRLSGSTSSPDTALIRHFPDPPARWDQMVRNSTPGRYPSHLPEAKTTKAKVPLSEGPRSSIAPKSVPATQPQPTQVNGRGKPPLPPIPQLAPPARGSVDSGKSGSASYYSSEDHLVTPNLTSTSVNFSFNKDYPIDRARGPVSLPPPPRKKEEKGDKRDSKRESKMTTGATGRTPRLVSYPSSDLEPASLVPRAQPKLVDRDVRLSPDIAAEYEYRPEIRNVRLPTAFDDARNVRLSMGSDFTVSTASSRPPGVGSSRARMSLSRAAK